MLFGDPGRCRRARSSDLNRDRRPPCDGCGVAVIGNAHDTLTPVPFAPASRPDYDARQLMLGLTIAAGFLVAAWRIATTIDWRPPSEADTPDLDLAEL